jgi:hypothetical protein
MPQTSSDYCTVKGPGIGALVEEIVSAYLPAELEQLVRLTFSEGLYAKYVPQNLTGEALVFSLLEALERRGTTVFFLRALRKSRPDRSSLVQLISDLCPAASNDAPSARSEVGRVAAGLELVRSRVKDLAVGASLSSSWEGLDLLAHGLARLRGYKALHDSLQKVQVQLYRSLVRDLSRLRIDPSVASTLDTQILQFAFFCEDARGGAQWLPDTPEERRMEMRMVVTPLISAETQLRDAISQMDDRLAALAVSSIRDVIRREPPRINARLTAVAEGLPLEPLRGTLERVLPSFKDDLEAAETLTSAVQALQNLLPRLMGKVGEHNHWQGIENELWATDQAMEQLSSEAVGEIALHWNKVVPLIDVLWQADPEALWVKKSRSFADSFRTYLRQGADEVHTSYGRFRNEAQLQFYRIDGELNVLCSQIMDLSRPLNKLLGERD